MKIKINVSSVFDPNGNTVHKEPGFFQIELSDRENNFCACTSWLHYQDKVVILERVGKLITSLRPNGPKLDYEFVPIEMSEYETTEVCNVETESFKLSQE